MLGVFATLVVLGASRPAQVAAQVPAPVAKPSAPLQVQETNEAGVIAEFVECKRKEGVLTVRIRLRNTGNAGADFYLISSRNYDSFYVTAEDKKYLVLRDEEKTPLAPAANAGGDVGVSIAKGGSWLWWAKYPAPPAGVKKINYVWPLGAPFEDIPIADQ
ncbi:MAG: hypothetical protein A2Y78_02690 [Acidobacteria bacterium RBG_13_68_16]|nr:MAG: hypothetical protein A2Y78_02690 [Acidobacteria bacterium RBG_13_68_16]